MIDRTWALSFAKEWIEAWNGADLERILSHYADDFEMSSPLIRERMQVASGRLAGKDAMRAYWSMGLAAKPQLRFELLDVLSGVDALAIYYRSVTRGKRVIEHLEFNADGLVAKAQALYCEDR
jgi:ketosteroid isomerase-like protein